MADRRPDGQEESRAKRLKSSKPEDMDPRANPYLAHMYEGASDISSSNGYAKSNGVNGAAKGASLDKFKRHETTSAMAKKAEDGPNNPFNGQPLSQQYFSILKVRRNLPVHAQRCENLYGRLDESS